MRTSLIGAALLSCLEVEWNNNGNYYQKREEK